MKLQPIKHEDNRRVLTEWIANFPITTIKILETKKDCELGNHYHRVKQDFFYLLKGKGNFSIGNRYGKFCAGETLTALPLEPHTIFLKKGSILLEASTTPYDKEDEIPTP